MYRTRFQCFFLFRTLETIRLATTVMSKKKTHFFQLFSFPTFKMLTFAISCKILSVPKMLTLRLRPSLFRQRICRKRIVWSKLNRAVSAANGHLSSYWGLSCLWLAECFRFSLEHGRKFVYHVNLCSVGLGKAFCLKLSSAHLSSEGENCIWFYNGNYT